MTASKVHLFADVYQQISYQESRSDVMLEIDYVIDQLVPRARLIGDLE